MKTPVLILGLAGALALGVVATVSVANPVRPADPAAPTADRLARGHYLVFRTGLCIDCHSPRNEKGEHIESQHLMGAPIPFAPTVPMPWVTAAPRLAGLPAGFTEEQFIHFLMTGERPEGRPPALPPMPPYRYDRDDAIAIAAYLRSLPSR